MIDEPNLLSSKGDLSASNMLYAAEVGQDPELETTTLSLSSTDQSNSSRNTCVCIAPEFGSNLFRFRVGQHDLIYTDQLLLKRRDFTGTFVLWPFPNRVRDQYYTYQGQRYSLEQVHRPGAYPTLIHGLVFDRPWHYTQPIIESHAMSVTTYFDVDTESPYYSAYPFESRLSLTYTLSRTELSVTYRVYNNPSSVKFRGVNKGRLLETMPGRAFICFVTSRKYHDIPGSKLDLTEEGNTLSGRGWYLHWTASTHQG